MTHTIIPLSQLTDAQLNQLTHLHQRAMHSLLTDLGLPFIERYYQIAHADSTVLGVCVVGDDVQGWAMGSSTPSRLNGRLRESLAWFIVQMLKVALTRPRLLLQILASAQTASAPMKAGAVELTYIGVDTSARKQGLGRELLNAFLATARVKGYTSVELSVEADNAAAIALYTSAGFVIVTSFKEGAFDRHRMELKL